MCVCQRCHGYTAMPVSLKTDSYRLKCIYSHFNTNLTSFFQGSVIGYMLCEEVYFRPLSHVNCYQLPQSPDSSNKIPPVISFLRFE